VLHPAARRTASLVIEVRALTKRYGDAFAVHDLCFTARPGHVTAFLGPNGAGKSTTMRLICGLARADGGEARLNGRRYEELRRPLREVGALLDGEGFHPGRRATDHLWALARSNRIDRSRVDHVLDVVGLASVAHKRAGTYSLGMAQRLGIAAALLGDPPILLLDEPVNGLDPDGIIWVRSLLRGLADEGRTVFVSSHLIGEVARCADRAVIVGRGRVLADTSTAELLAGDRRRHVRVRTTGAPRLAEALRATGGEVAAQPDGTLAVRGLGTQAVASTAAALGLVPTELGEHEPSLEDVYLSLTQDSLQHHRPLHETGAGR
jgi:ABC-2 type transport system ATP-binding protein